MIKKNIIGLDTFAIITFKENNLYEYSYHFPDFKTSFILDQIVNENKIGRILSKEWYGSSSERNFRMHQLNYKYK